MYDVQNLVHDVVGALNDRTAVEEHMNRLAMDRLGHGPAYDKWVKNGPQRPKQIWDEQSLPSRVRDEDLLEHVSAGGQERFVKVAELLKQQEKEWCSTIFYGRSEADRKREEKKRDDAWHTRFSTMTGAPKQRDQKGTPQFEADEEVVGSTEVGAGRVMGRRWRSCGVSARRCDRVRVSVGRCEKAREDVRRS